MRLPVPDRVGSYNAGGWLSADRSITPLDESGIPLVCMKKYQSNFLLAIAAFVLVSCVGENRSESTLIELNSPDPERQIMALGDNQMRVDINVNAGSTQTFFFNTAGSALSANIAGVLNGERNFIQLKWSEILNGHPVEISQQSQNFIADGNTLVNAEHIHTQFDYDSDGRSNYDERRSETCVWSSTESCNSSTDIPTDNVLLNGDFASDRNYWWSTFATVTDTNGEFCISTRALGQLGEQALMGYSPGLFIQANTRYTLDFDVRADTDLDVRVSIVAPVRLPLKEETVPVSTTYESKSISFINAEDSHTGVSLGFNFLNDGVDKQYCFDNIKLINNGA